MNKLTVHRSLIMMYPRNSHCSYCGQAFPANAAWPRVCANCRQWSFLNPTPVTVVLVPVDNGVLTVRRNIEPGKGQLALPGGYVNAGESWQAAGAREVEEETGLRIAPDELRLLAVHSTAPSANSLLIFALAQPRTEADLAAFQPNAEVTECVVLTAPHELAFSLHTHRLREYFASHAG